jgi:hypothetical protein
VPEHRGVDGYLLDDAAVRSDVALQHGEAGGCQLRFVERAGDLRDVVRVGDQLRHATALVRLAGTLEDEVIHRQIELLEIAPRLDVVDEEELTDIRGLRKQAYAFLYESDNVSRVIFIYVANWRAQ